MKHYLSTDWLILLLFACSGSMKDDGNSELLIILVNVAQNSPVRLSEIADDIRKIELETSDECLIGRISQVVCKDDRIFVLDYQAGSLVHVFDLTGKFLYAINKRGQGPGDYLSIRTITVDPKNGHLYVASQGGKILRFDTDTGHFIDECTNMGFIEYIRYENDCLHVFSKEIRPSDDNSSTSITDFMVIYGNNWQPIDTVLLNKMILRGLQGSTLPNKDFISTDNRNNLFVYCPVLLLEPFVRDTLYRLDKNILKPYAKLKFSDEDPSQKNKNILCISLTSNLLIAEYLSFSKKGNRYFCYDFRSKTGKNMLDGFQDDIFDTGVVAIRLLNDGYFYFWKEAEDLSPSGEEPNPTLYIGKFKD